MRPLRQSLGVLVLAIACLMWACGGGGASAPRATAAGDPCSLPSYSVGDISYPASYLGAYPLPAAATRLPAAIVRTLNLQDVDVWWTKPAANLCANRDTYRLNALVEDLNRAKNLGVERIWVYNTTHWDDFSAPGWTAQESQYVLPRAVLQSFVKEAHSRGIKVFYAFQWAFDCDLKGACLDLNNLTADQLSRILDAHKRQIVSDASFGAQIGLDGIKAELDAFQPKNAGNFSAALREVYVQKTMGTLDEIRKVFSGGVTYGQSNAIFDERIISKVDELILSLFLARNVSPFNVNSWRQEVATTISNFQYWIWQDSGLQSVSTPIAWEIYAESAQEFYSSAWLDKFCTKTAIQQGQCPQQSMVTDFSMQAIAIEGALQALAAQAIFSSKSVSFYGYSHADVLVPTEVGGGGAVAFPNLDNSIRNKPAEKIVQYAFARP